MLRKCLDGKMIHGQENLLSVDRYSLLVTPINSNTTAGEVDSAMTSLAEEFVLNGS